MTHVNRPTSQRRRSGRALLAGLPIILLIGAACSGSDEDSASAALPADASQEVAADQQADDRAAPAAAAPDTAAAEGGVSPATGLTAGPAPERLLVVDVTVDVEVGDVGASVADVVTAAARHEGAVYGSNVQLADDDTATAQIVIKLPPDQVDAAIAEISALGRLITQMQTTDDVTDRVTDIDTRIISQQQSVDRVQHLLAEAVNLGEIVQLEAELTARQTVLEELLAQQRNLGQQTALATLTVNLRAAEAVAPIGADQFSATAEVSTGDSIGDAFRSGGASFVNAVAAVVIVIGYTAPFLAVGLVALGVWALTRRRRARRNRSAAPLLPPVPDEGRQTTEPDSVGAARS
jgi:uncharacterized protein YoaH (UPF0181 family)